MEEKAPLRITILEQSYWKTIVQKPWVDNLRGERIKWRRWFKIASSAMTVESNRQTWWASLDVPLLNALKCFDTNASGSIRLILLWKQISDIWSRILNKCPVCMKQCKCGKCNFEKEDDESKEPLEPRKKSLRIREAKQTAKGKVYFDSLK